MEEMFREEDACLEKPKVPVLPSGDDITSWH